MARGPAGAAVPVQKWLLLAVVGLCTAFPAVGQQSANEQAVWKLESAYWNYVKAADLEGYRTLWHKDFVGWPYSNAQPARKDHITEWITALTGKGLHLQWYSIEPAASQATENIVITHYWVTAFWADKAGQGDAPETSAHHPHVDQDRHGMADSRRHVLVAAFREVTLPVKLRRSLGEGARPVRER